MKISRFLIVSAASALMLMFACTPNAREKVKIAGRLANSANTKLLVFEILPDSTFLADSVNTDENGNFSLITEPVDNNFLLIRRDAKNYVTLIASKGESIVIEGDGENLIKTCDIKGSPESSILMGFNKKLAYADSKLDSLREIFNNSQSYKNFPEIKRSLDSTFSLIFEDFRKETIDYLQQHKSSLASLLILDRSLGHIPLVSKETDFDLYTSVDSCLWPKYSDNKHVIVFHTNIEQYKKRKAAEASKNEKLAVGMSAPEIRLPDASGKTHSLKASLSDYTLVCFWASWNAPCRKLNQELAGIYGDFHSKGFTIFSVSIDPNRAQWIDAYRQDKAVWIQVNDSAGLTSETAKKYKVGSIPSTFLLDRSGKIIALNPAIQDLKALLIGKK